MPALNVQNGACLVALLASVAMALVVMAALNRPLRRYLLRVCESGRPT